MDSGLTQPRESSHRKCYSQVLSVIGLRDQGAVYELRLLVIHLARRCPSLLVGCWLAGCGEEASGWRLKMGGETRRGWRSGQENTIFDPTPRPFHHTRRCSQNPAPTRIRSTPVRGFGSAFLQARSPSRSWESWQKCCLGRCTRRPATAALYSGRDAGAAEAPALAVIPSSQRTTALPPRVRTLDPSPRVARSHRRERRRATPSRAAHWPTAQSVYHAEPGMTTCCTHGASPGPHTRGTSCRPGTAPQVK